MHQISSCTFTARITSIGFWIQCQVHIGHFYKVKKRICAYSLRVAWGTTNAGYYRPIFVVAYPLQEKYLHDPFWTLSMVWESNITLATTNYKHPSHHSDKRCNHLPHRTWLSWPKTDSHSINRLWKFWKRCDSTTNVILKITYNKLRNKGIKIFGIGFVNVLHCAVCIVYNSF